jgi:16S rRNA U516 pseudouridylate synthase RsuA-like enzyme
VRGAYDASADLDQLSPAKPLDCAFLQEAQKLHLQRQRDIAHLVKEQRAARSIFDFAFGRLDCTGEGALLMAKELAFEQVFCEIAPSVGD